MTGEDQCNMGVSGVSARRPLYLSVRDDPNQQL